MSANSRPKPKVRDVRVSERSPKPAPPLPEPQTGPRAIETRYAGRRFRSRVEARWAIFLDTLGIAWEYEREGFKLGAKGDIYYLPDFWLPDLRAWLEIKGTTPTDFEVDKAALLCQETGFPVYIFFDGLDVRRPGTSAWAEFPIRHASGVAAHWDDGHRWAECKGCGALTIVNVASAKKGKCQCGQSNFDPASERLCRAYTAGLSARFEFGERPAPPRNPARRKPRKKA